MKDLSLRLLSAWYALTRRDFILVVRAKDDERLEIIGTFEEAEQEELLNVAFE